MSLQKKINGYIPNNRCLAYVRKAQAVDESCVVEYHFLPTQTVLRKPLCLNPTDLDIVHNVRDAVKEYASLSQEIKPA